MNFLSVLIAALCTFAITVPARAGAGDAPWKKYFPTGTNTAWIYELTNHHTQQKRRFNVVVKGSVYIPEMKRTVIILDEDQLGEHHPIGYYEDDKGFLNRFVYLEYEGTNVTYPGTNSTGERILPADLIDTKTWDDSPVVIGASSHSKYQVNPGLEVHVPAGKFTNCMLVEATVEGSAALEAVSHEATHDIFKDWYAPGVGLIRSEAYNEKFIDSPEVSYELVEYHLK